jgi:hypothetical protein
MSGVTTGYYFISLSCVGSLLIGHYLGISIRKELHPIKAQ